MHLNPDPRITKPSRSIKLQEAAPNSFSISPSHSYSHTRYLKSFAFSESCMQRAETNPNHHPLFFLPSPLSFPFFLPLSSFVLEFSPSSSLPILFHVPSHLSSYLSPSLFFPRSFFIFHLHRESRTPPPRGGRDGEVWVRVCVRQHGAGGDVIHGQCCLTCMPSNVVSRQRALEHFRATGK